MICPAILEPPPCAATVNVRPNLTLVNSLVAANRTSSPRPNLNPAPRTTTWTAPYSPDYPEPKAITDAEELTWDLDSPWVENAIPLGKRLSTVATSTALPLRWRTHVGLARAQHPSHANRQWEPVGRDHCGSRSAAGLPRWRAQGQHDLRPGIWTSCCIPRRSCSSSAPWTKSRGPLLSPGLQVDRAGLQRRWPRPPRPLLGAEPIIKTDFEKTMRFLDVMDFASPADRTNAVAAAFTVLLRNHFPGGKPLINVTANKSHAGKDTIIVFAAGLNQITEISYQAHDWALERDLRRRR